MPSFPWKKFGGNYWNNPPAPSVVVEFAGPDGPLPIEGLFDTGADSTELAYDLIRALGINFDRCAAMKAHGQSIGRFPRRAGIPVSSSGPPLEK